MNIRSAKNKGRRLCLALKDMILAAHRDLFADDIRVTSASAPGEDLILSPSAQRAFPFSVECKNQESIQIWAALAQAENHALKSGRTALLCFTRNRAPTYVALRVEPFLLLQAKARLFERTLMKGGIPNGEGQ